MEGKKAIKGYSGPYRGRNDYYRDGSYILMLIVNFLAIVMVALTIALAIYLCTRHTHDRYFAETVDGKIMPMTALSSPNTENFALANWAASAASDIMTFGFNDFDVRLNNSRKYFTPEGWESFYNALKVSKLVEDVKKTQQIATAVPRALPELKRDGLIDGKMRWEIDVPLLITFRAGSDIRPIPKKVHMVVEKMPTRENPDGVGISEWDLH